MPKPEESFLIRIFPALEGSGEYKYTWRWLKVLIVEFRFEEPLSLNSFTLEKATLLKLLVPSF